MITRAWHRMLNMRRHARQWHQDRLNEELQELREARGFLHTWSELSDVVYDYTRARCAGHTDIPWPLSRRHYVAGWPYMILKYTLRWLFYRRVGACLGKPGAVSEVRNNKKEEKLRCIARRNGFDEDRFVRECRRVEQHWLFLP